MALMDDDARRVPMAIRVVWALLLIAAIGLSVWGVLRVITAKESHDQVMASLAVERDDAEATYKRSSVSEAHDAAETSQRLDAARVAARQLSEAENGYQSVSVDDRNGYVQERIDPLFADDVESSDKQWMSLLSVPYVWHEVPCVMIDAYDVPCAWICEADGQFMGYVTARFDPSTGKFFGVKRVRSNLVRNYYGSERSDGNGGTEVSSSAGGTSSDASQVTETQSVGSSDASVGVSTTNEEVGGGDAFSR